MNKLFKNDEFLIFDGSMGVLLQKYGLKIGELPESYNIKYPEIVSNIHKSYIAAGADVIITNTFGASRYKLKDSGYGVGEIVKSSLDIARKAAGDKLIALDIGPIGQLMEPYGTLSFQDAYDAFAEQIVEGAYAADMILIETMSDIYEVKAAVLAAKENSSLPVICTMTFQADGRTLTGTDPITMVNILSHLGVDALGVNCSLGPKEMIPVLAEILKYSSVPVIVQPNAGLPALVDGKTIFNISPESFGKYMAEMAGMGASMLGGCCGTNPDHIRALKEAVTGLKPKRPRVEKLTAASSATATAVIGEGIKIIGERINPTGKVKLKEALKNDDMDYLLKEAIAQRDAGAHILDVNVGLPEIDEKEIMVKAVKQIQGIVNLPLQLDSTNPDVIEAAARIYNGRPIINSVNGEKKTMDKIFPIVKKYGCLVVALTLDEKGIPEKAEDRLKIAERIVRRAEEFGIDREDIIVDCLVLTASAQQKEVQETIKAAALVKERLGLRTTLGVSNVSFGLPDRELLNRTFLTMALASGLDAPIINPMAEDMMNAIKAYNVLRNIDKDAKEYIASRSSTTVSTAVKEKETVRDLTKIIIDGMKEEAAPMVRQLLSNHEGIDIVDNYLIPALDIVGQKYESGEIFLPQLIQSAETVKNAFNAIKEHILQNAGEGSGVSKGKVVIATVKGDIHDIGKNIVKILLENYGFQVFDLGKDVETEEIVKKVRREKAALVGLSALMTTTVKSMEETIKALRKHCPDIRVMVGGAVLNADYAKMIGADFYGKDAREAVKITRKFYGCE
ncbi:MAG TPA: homocysteine S-methyltransferase family protein [Bacillota bacterium]|nr:homocysteine S-methyltransferase family protein [Bacillota bacterium]HPL54012.1 homocysteine S-methyltransferase family protein [Bacillota bacterium]